MSPVLKEVVHRLQHDLSFATDFLNSPVSALTGYDLNPEEHQALVARDLQSLQQLGVSGSDVWAAASGGHSQRCTSKQ